MSESSILVVDTETGEVVKTYRAWDIYQNHLREKGGQQFARNRQQDEARVSAGEEAGRRLLEKQRLARERTQPLARSASPSDAGPVSSSARQSSKRKTADSDRLLEEMERALTDLEEWESSEATSGRPPPSPTMDIHAIATLIAIGKAAMLVVSAWAAMAVIRFCLPGTPQTTREEVLFSLAFLVLIAALIIYGSGLLRFPW